MILRTTFFIYSTLLFSSVFAQEKKTIDHTCYNDWRSIKTVTLSSSGNFTVYDAAPPMGDATLYIYNRAKNTSQEYARGKQLKINDDESLICFLVEPQYDTVRALKLADTPKDKMPKDSLFILHTQTDSLMKFDGIKSFSLSQKSNLVAFLSHTDQRPDCPKSDPKKKKKKNNCEKIPTSGTTLSLYNSTTGQVETFNCVTNYVLSDNGEQLFYVQSKKGKKDTLSLLLYKHKDSSTTLLIDKQFGIVQLSLHQESGSLAFLSTTDTNTSKNYSLYFFNSKENLTGCIVDSMNQSMPKNWGVSEFGRLQFNEDGDKIYFGINELISPEPEDTLLDSEKAKVDIWGSNDLRIQPHQLIELNSDKKLSYDAVYFLGEKKMIQLTKPEMSGLRINTQSNSRFLLGTSDLPYQREYTWEYPWKSDFYLVEESTGNATMILQGSGFATSLAPSGNYLIYYSGADSNWYSIETETKKKINLTDKISDKFASDNNGNPALADEEGFVGWTLVSGLEKAVVYSENQIWMLDPKGDILPNCLTCNEAEKNAFQHRYYRLDYDSLYTNLSQNFVIRKNNITKDESICQLEITGDKIELISLVKTQHKINYISKSEKNEVLVIRKMNFYEYPDIEISDDNFQTLKKISNINPRQKEYNWGTVEMVSWTSYEGRNLKGLVYKPENFDPSKKYPMIVYFYEKYTDDIHVYYSPKPTASIVYPTEYVSNGYIMFIPDIEYTPGYPAKSAYDCIMSGTDYLVRNYSWIDSTRMGLQGQSWGGYQTAQLITMTTRFKAAMAGAPVSNMTSAYGGIRWGSGLSRMFQYEKTQSRIGYTLWERPDLYMLNSPVFALNKVNTPLLIMSNDGDGAVPWYQGIELYMGLRRLGQPVWMLNYNEDEHNLLQLANKFDLSIRMRQFFDHYLLGKPMPEWMSTGIPATEKGTNYGFGIENSGN